MDMKMLRARRWLDVEDMRPKMETLTALELKRWKPTTENETRQTNEDRLSIIYRGILMKGVCWKYSKPIYPEMFSHAMEAMFEMRTFSGMPYPFTLAIGEAYENAVVAMFLSLGIRSGRYRQTGIPAKLLRAFQRDIYIRDSDGLILNIELKALNDSSYMYNGVLVGDIGKWDEKRFRVDICLVVHQATGVILWTDADDVARTTWLKHTNKYGLSYIVPHGEWKPLETLVTALGYAL